MSRRLLLKNGTVVDPSQNLTAKRDVLIERNIGHGTRVIGKIVAVAENIVAEDAEVIDCTGKLVVPGLVDMHVHFREPGEEHKETIATGSAAAVAGGFTTVCCMPNTIPPIDSPLGIGYILWKAQNESKCRILPVGAVSIGLKHEMLSEMGKMCEEGAVAFSDDGAPIQNAGFLRKVLEYAKICDLPVMLHCEDKSLTEGGVMNSGRVALSLGLRGMPPEGETIAIFRAVELAITTGTRVHIQHISVGRSVELIRMAKEMGAKVSCEVTPHHLVLTEEAVEDYNTFCKVNPPLRTREDVEMLIEGLNGGVIDVIATDHAPHAIEDKEVEFEKAAFGTVGLETAVGVIIGELVMKGKLRLERAIECMSTSPAKILSIDAGTLKVGASADVTIIDPNLEYIVEPSEFKSKGKNSAFIGWKLRGKAIITIVNGEIAYCEMKRGES
ncbi:MAG: dihydroorotase [Armatimonadetes bacterium]|nr:dihydroorotase [Armatimonadota bacterium]